MHNPKDISPPILPVAEKGVQIFKPQGHGLRNWIGASSVIYDESDGFFYLYYRIRKPRPIRGYICRIARSKDGIHFKDIWEATKEEIGTESIERACLRKTSSGLYQLYLSYVDPNDRVWRIDLLEAPNVQEFDIKKKTPVLMANQTNGIGVKDPVILRIGGLYHMFVSLAMPITGQKDFHETGDAFATGKTKSVTGSALSDDGKHFEWRGVFLHTQEEGWDSLMCRVSAVLYQPPLFHIYYDGTHTHNHDYPGRTGLAISLDLKTLHRLTKNGPIVQSPHATHSLRYLDYTQKGKDLYFYYECATPDGSNELRMNIIKDYFILH